MNDSNDAKMEINSKDVIKLMLQFCKENNLFQTMRTLEQETNTKLNTVDSIDDFKVNILKGKWDLTLKILDKVSIPPSKLLALYEQIIYELLEANEKEVAKSFLYNLNSNINEQIGNSQQYIRLENLVNSSNFNAEVLYAELETTKQKNREALSESLAKEVTTVAPNRLLVILSQGFKHLYSGNQIPKDFTKFDFFTGRIDKALSSEEGGSVPVKSLYKEIKFDTNSFVECAKFSYDGNYLATGSVDGFIEVWDPRTAKLKQELTYQLEDVLMFHKESVISLNFSKDSKMICSGDNGGNIKIFKVANGKCLREFDYAHSKGITAVVFSKDNSMVISGSFDGLIRIFGLKAGSMLKELGGHSSFVNDLQIDWGTDRIVSASSDGTVKVWDFKHYSLLNEITLPTITETIEVSINNICINKKFPNKIFISNKSNNVYLTTLEGEVLKYYSTEKNAAITYHTISHDGEWLYCVDEDNYLYTFSVEHCLMRNKLKIHTKDVIGLTHHPFDPLLASYSLDGSLNFYN